jgi:xanthine phosphoribosyltransferase
MRLLEEKILKAGKVFPGNVLKVDCFLNHQIDIALTEALAKEWHTFFIGENVTKVLTVEASGIAPAAFTAKEFGVPLVFAKKAKTKNSSADVYSADGVSFTRGVPFTLSVSKEFLSASDRVLIIDDFLATGSAMNALLGIVSQSGARTVGVGIAIEKAFQGGGDALRTAGIKLCSLAVIDDMTENSLTFRNSL